MSTMFCIIPVLLSILLVCSQILVANASIRLLNLGKEYQSRPDKYVGLQMEEGIEYGARLQSIKQDLLDEHLCGGGKLNVTVPNDGRPVALLVKKGLCSNAQKAEFASRNIHPPGVVKVLIIDGELRIRDDGEDAGLHEVDHNLNIHQHDSEDKNPFPLSSYESPSYYNWRNETAVTLRRRQADGVSVTLLHVSYATGIQLLDVVLHEDPEVQKEGGTVLTVDGVAPRLSRTVVVIWFTACVAVSLLCCICLVNCVQELLENLQPEPEPPRSPRRPRRRRLTLEQVRKLPIGSFNGCQLVYDEETINENDFGEDEFSNLKPQPENIYCQPVGQSLDACTICLDEYEIGDLLRCLPCGHAFHANCIAKWLIERSATCPLCKIDLYEEDEDDEDEESEAQQLQAEPQIIEVTGTIEYSAATREAWWRNIFRTMEERLRISEALTEPLLHQHQQQEEPSELERSELVTVEETQITEEAITTRTNQPNES